MVPVSVPPYVDFFLLYIVLDFTLHVITPAQLQGKTETIPSTVVIKMLSPAFVKRYILCLE